MTPQIIRTADELAALDPDTMLFSYDWELYEDAEYWIDSIDDDVFPLAVIATGDQVRAARQALEEE